MTTSPYARFKRGGVATLLVLAALICAPGANAAEEEPAYPGLPKSKGSGMRGAWMGVVTSTLSETARSKQWVRTPPALMALDMGETYNTRLMIDGESVTRFDQIAKAYPISPAGSPEPYGYFPSAKVRTLAFGAIPVELTLDVAMPRDEDNLPLPLVARQLHDSYNSGKLTYEDAYLEGEVILSLSDLRVDGVQVDLGPSCRTTEPATMTLSGKGYWVQDPALEGEALPWQPLFFPPPDLTTWRDTQYYVDMWGGLLEGELDIPPFIDCGTIEDMSPLITAVTSGPDNQMTVRQTYAQACWGDFPMLPCPDFDAIDIPAIPTIDE